MNVLIEVEDGIGYASWTDECGTEKEEYLGEVSDRWLKVEAEEYFGKRLSEDVVIEIKDVYYYIKINKDDIVAKAKGE